LVLHKGKLSHLCKRHYVDGTKICLLLRFAGLTFKTNNTEIETVWFVQASWCWWG